MAQAGSTSQFCVHKLWRIQDITDACRIHSDILYIAILLFQDPRQEKEATKDKKKKKVGS
jgi:hypothetical protein